MDFTALHRALGAQPIALTDELLDAAVGLGVAETDDLDWKRAAPAEGELSQSDLVKDIAAMANSGGGTIVFGVEENQKAATKRCDVGEISESYLRTLRRTAVSGIQPPVFNLDVRLLGKEGKRALIVIVPPSTDAPHLIYRGEYFGAPVRNNADTEWMRERQLEATYRRRLEDRRSSQEALDRLYLETVANRDAASRIWFIAVARPRVARIGPRMDIDQARRIFADTVRPALELAGRLRYGEHALANVAGDNPRIGLRRWVAPNTAVTQMMRFYESWISVHDDGAVTVAAAVGGQPWYGNSWFAAHQVNSLSLECCIADLMALIRQTSSELGTGDYELQVGLEWQGHAAPTILAPDMNFALDPDEQGTPLPQTGPLTTAVRTDVGQAAYRDQVCDLAIDILNSGGIRQPRLIVRQSI